MKRFSSKRRWIAAAMILLLLFIVRPGASRLKSRIITSISSGVGRPADISSVHLRLLPRPGFDLGNLVVYDDPAFGAEPILQASQVTAWLRLTSLVRGRLEIARLDLTEPSLNLVHGVNGRWNVEALLERTAHTPLAPTGKAKSEPRPGFPYIDATSARINLKNGQEKKPYALANADFSLWQDSENAWGLRLRAQPIRTDLNLNDMGVLRVNGNWQRAAVLRDTPIDFTLEWSRAQLGQLTKFLTGNDQGWRGGIQLDVSLTGTPAKLQISTDASIQDFRRYDITSGEPLGLVAHCNGQYSSLDHAFHEIVCGAPMGSGRIILKGDAGLPGSHNHEILFTADDIPVNTLVALAGRAKKNLPADLMADGTLRGSLFMHEGGTSKPGFEGEGEISQFRLVSAASESAVGPQTVPFVFTSSGDDSRKRAQRQLVRKTAAVLRLPEGPHLEFGPFFLGTGRTESATARGWMNRAGYAVVVAGDAEVGSMLRVAGMFGIPALQTAAEGTAQVDLQVAGSWAASGKATTSDFPGPQVTGSVGLRNVRVGVKGVGEPVDITSADLQLSPDQARLEKLNAKAAGTLWTGSLEMPRGCGTPSACQIRFDLNANQIALGELSAWLSPRPKPRPWYRVLESRPQPGPSFLAALEASGRLTTEHLRVQHVAATRVSANVSLAAGKLEVTDLNADFFGARHHGGWKADFSAQSAVCSGNGNLTGVSLAQLADTMKDPWIAGSANASYEVKGPCAAEFWHSAEGTVQFAVRDGTLPHISLGEDEEALKISLLSGQARLHAGKIEVKDAKLDSPSGRFHLSGTASLQRELNLKLARTAAGNAAGGYSVTGTLAEPRVVPLPGAEQARLKPEAAK